MTGLTHRTHRHFGRTLLAGALLACAATTMAQASSPTGLWQTIDDKTGQPKAVVQIVQDPDGWAIGGHSSGGMAAFNVAWFYPDKFHKVITASPSRFSRYLVTA